MTRRILTILVLSVLLATAVNVAVAWGYVLSGHDPKTRSTVGAPRDVDRRLWVRRHPALFPDAPLLTVRFSEDRGLRTSRWRVYSVRQVQDPPGWVYWDDTQWVHVRSFKRLPDEVKRRRYELYLIEAGWPFHSFRSLHWYGHPGVTVTQAGIRIEGGPVSWEDPSVPRVLPLLPIATGFIANESIYLLLCGLAVFAARRVLRSVRGRRCIAQGRCPECAVALCGRTVRTCPGCDRHFLDARYRWRRPRLRQVAALLLLGASTNLLVAWWCASGLQSVIPGGAGAPSSLSPSFGVDRGTRPPEPGERDWLGSDGQLDPYYGGGQVTWTQERRVGLDQMRFTDAYGSQVLGATSWMPLTFRVKSRAGWPMATVAGERWARLADDGTTEARHVTAIPLVSFLPGFVSPEHLEQFLPYRPLWSGAVVNTLCYAALWWILAAAFAYGRLSFRRGRVRCPECGYDLRGASGGGCPECAWGAATESPRATEVSPR